MRPKSIEARNVVAGKLRFADAAVHLHAHEIAGRHMNDGRCGMVEAGGRAVIRHYGVGEIFFIRQYVLFRDEARTRPGEGYEANIRLAAHS